MPWMNRFYPFVELDGLWKLALSVLSVAFFSELVYDEEFVADFHESCLLNVFASVEDGVLQELRVRIPLFSDYFALIIEVKDALVTKQMSHRRNVRQAL